MNESRRLAEHPIIRYWLWLVIATSSAVHIEPALCDLLAIGLLGAAFALGLNIPRGLGVAALFVGVFLLGNMVASALAPQPSISIVPMATRVYLFAAWWFLISCLSYQSPTRAYETIWSGYLFAAMLAALLGTLAFFGVIPSFGQLMESGRARALFNDPNVYGPFLVPAALYTLSRMESLQPARAFVFLGLFMFLGLSLILGFSRGSWLNLAAAVTAYFALRLRSQKSPRQRKRLINTVLGMGVATAMALTIALSVGPIRDMLELRAKVVQFYDIESRLGGDKSRMDAQRERLELAMTVPVGIGAGQSMADYYQGKAPHNLYLHVLVESGWLGGLAFYAFLVLTFWQSRRCLWLPSEIQPLYQVAFASLFGILVQSVFVDSTHWRQMYMLLGMLWGPILAVQVRRSPVAARIFA